MLAFQIKSLQHSIVKYCVKIRNDSAFRKEEGLLLIYGKKVIEELPSSIKIHSIFSLTDSLPSKICENFYTVTPEILKKITNFKNPEPYAALVYFPVFTNLKLQKLLICDRIKDPGNMGTLIRTAGALGFDAIYLLEGCVDPYNEKVVNATKGALFFLPLLKGDWDQLLELTKENNLTLYQADLEGESFLNTPISSSLGLILGNESEGTSFLAKKHAIKLCIPMTNKAESLNVAVAGGILMFHLSRLCQKTSTKL